MSEEIKLLPCPCCESEAKIGILEKHFTFYQAVCLECGLTAKATPTPELTASLWNTRKPMDRIVEQLEKEWMQADKDMGLSHTIEDCSIGYGKAVAFRKAIDIVRGGKE